MHCATTHDARSASTSKARAARARRPATSVPARVTTRVVVMVHRDRAALESVARLRPKHQERELRIRPVPITNLRICLRRSVLVEDWTYQSLVTSHLLPVGAPAIHGYATGYACINTTDSALTPRERGVAFECRARVSDHPRDYRSAHADACSTSELDPLV